MLENTMAAPTLSDFTSQLKTRNIAKPNMYYVQIVPPPSMAFGDTNLVSMWCSAAHTPHTYLMTNDNYLEAGIKRKYAYDVDHQNLVLNFYLDQDYRIKQFFDEWKHRIVPYNRQFNYPDNYTAENITVYLIDNADENVYKYEYSRVFPKTINSVELSYANGTTIAGLNVEFVFEDVYYTSFKNTDMLFSSKPQVNIQQERQNITNAELNKNMNPRDRK